MTRRRYNPRAAQRRANDRAEDKAHDERVWEAERKRLAAEAQAAESKAQQQDQPAGENKNG